MSINMTNGYTEGLLLLMKKKYLLQNNAMSIPNKVEKKYNLVKINERQLNWISEYGGIVYYTGEEEFHTTGNRLVNGFYQVRRNSYDGFSVSGVKCFNWDDSHERILNICQCFLTKELVRNYKQLTHTVTGITKRLQKKEEKEFRKQKKNFNSMNIDNPLP